MKRVALLVLSLAFATAAHMSGQIPEDREALLNGEGSGMGKYAEVHGYPGPKHVLELSDKLNLTKDQKTRVKEIFDEMKTRAKELGKLIVKIEEELNYAFDSGMLKPETIEDDTEQIGKLRGNLRGVHLTAHIKTKGVLTKPQLELYPKLRQESKPTGTNEHKHQ